MQTFACASQQVQLLFLKQRMFYLRNISLKSSENYHHCVPQRCQSYIHFLTMTQEYVFLKNCEMISRSSNHSVSQLHKICHTPSYDAFPQLTVTCSRPISIVIQWHKLVCTDQHATHCTGVWSSVLGEIHQLLKNYTGIID